MISSQETAFELNFPRKFDAELLIGQVSYSQKADIYISTRMAMIHLLYNWTHHTKKGLLFIYVVCMNTVPCKMVDMCNKDVGGLCG